jgi:dTDP-4-amino-4,6-dideoxygalactose transaminase
MIALNSPLKPDINKLQHYLEQINNNGWLTNFGPLEQELTDRLASYLGVEHMLLVNNGTSALQVAAQTLGLENIITTPFTFIATTSSFVWQKKKISFADIDINSFNLSPTKVIDSLNKPFAKGENIDGIVATHVYGNPCDVDAFDNIQQTSNVKVIYDAAHAFGIKVNDNSVLNYGDASILSFHATKLFHTAEGGAIVFKNQASLLRAKSLINFGFQDGEHSGLIGINAKLNEYQAAIGLVNLDIIDSVIAHRVTLYELYLTELNSVVQFSTWHTEANYNGAYMAIYFVNNTDLTTVINALTSEKIEHRKYFESVDLLLNYTCDLKNSHKISQGILCLPLHTYLTKNDVLNICSVIKSALLKNL